MMRKYSGALSHMTQEDCGIVRLSVVVTSYNHERYIRDALDGIVAQNTSFKYEVIVHDDASIDGSQKIIGDYAERYSVIKPIFQKTNQYGKGEHVFYKYILPEIKGEYIAFCEGDDYWIRNNKLQEAVDYLDSHQDCGAVYHNCVIVDSANRQSADLAQLKSCYRIFEEKDYSLLEFAASGVFPGQLAGMTIRKSAFGAVCGGPSEYLGLFHHSNGDGQNLILAYGIGRVHILPAVAVAHRVVVDSGGSWSAINHSKNNLGELCAAQLELRKLAKKSGARFFWNYWAIGRLGLRALVKSRISPTMENTRQADIVFSLFDNRVSCILFLAKNLMLGFPIRMFFRIKLILFRGTSGSLCFDESVPVDLPTLLRNRF